MIAELINAANNVTQILKGLRSWSLVLLKKWGGVIFTNPLSFILVDTIRINDTIN